MADDSRILLRFPGVPFLYARNTLYVPDETGHVQALPEHEYELRRQGCMDPTRKAKKAAEEAAKDEPATPAS